MTRPRIIYMGKNKPSVIAGLRYLIKNEIEVVAVIGSNKEQLTYNHERLIDVAKDLNLQTITNEEIYEIIEADKFVLKKRLKKIDFVISFLFWEKIKKPLIDLSIHGCLNFHPAPLPEFGGVGVYNFGIFEQHKDWGVTVHYVDETFDTGDIIEVKKFDIDMKKETAYTLEKKSQEKLLELFRQTMKKISKGEKLPRNKQNDVRYFSKKDFEKLRRIEPNDTQEVIDRKIRACWCPPYPGAVVKIQGKEYTLVNDEIIKKIDENYYFKYP